MLRKDYASVERPVSLQQPQLSNAAAVVIAAAQKRKSALISTETKQAGKTVIRLSSKDPAEGASSRANMRCRSNNVVREQFVQFSPSMKKHSGGRFNFKVMPPSSVLALDQKHNNPTNQSRERQASENNVRFRTDASLGSREEQKRSDQIQSQGEDEPI